jgi:nucleoid-associated protein YgaU
MTGYRRLLICCLTLLAVCMGMLLYTTVKTTPRSQLLADSGTAPTVTLPRAPAAPALPRGTLRAALPHWWTVTGKRTLTAAARAVYGRSRLWPALYLANRRLLGRYPGDMDYGMTLLVPRDPARFHYTPPPPPAAPPPSPAPAPVNTPAAAVGVGEGNGGAFETCVIAHESGGNPTAVNPTSGAGGLFQFLPSTWAALGYASSYPGGAQTAPVSVQYAAFNALYASAGTAPWSGDGCA